MIDLAKLDQHLSVGDKILVDYGGVVLTVIGFESEEKYIMLQKRINKLKEKVERTEGKAPSPSQKSLQQDLTSTTQKRLRSPKKQNSFVKTHNYSDNEEGEWFSREEI